MFPCREIASLPEITNPAKLIAQPDRKMKIKIKDLPKDFQLVGKKLYIPIYVQKKQPELLSKMIIRSGWNKGFWCVKKEKDSQIFPVFFEDFNEVKEWRIENSKLIK